MLIAPTKSVMESSLLKIIRDNPSCPTISKPRLAAQAGKLLKWDQVNVLNVPSGGLAGGSASLPAAGPSCTLGTRRWREEAETVLSWKRQRLCPDGLIWDCLLSLSPVPGLLTPLKHLCPTPTQLLGSHTLSFVSFWVHCLSWGLFFFCCEETPLRLS